MPDSPKPESESDFVCDCEEWMRFACAGEPFDLEGKRYCVLHFPGTRKSADFKPAFEKKLDNEDFDFRGVWFPDDVSFAKRHFTGPALFRGATFHAQVDFNSATFSAEADFTSAVFNKKAEFLETTFNAKAYFMKTTFNADAHFLYAAFGSGAHFSSAEFSAKANFISSKFSLEAVFTAANFHGKTYFDGATFGGKAAFLSATFSGETKFRGTTFRSVTAFRNATFGHYVQFAGVGTIESLGDESSLNLEFARIGTPDHVSFHSLPLHPHWFINVDACRFDFVNVSWQNRGDARKELELLAAKRVPSKHRLLAIACRKLSAKSEANDRYGEASDFRRMAMDAERLETWGGFDVRKLNWWYWLASGYGERPFQALLVLFGVLLIFGLLYTRVGFARWEPKLTSEADAVVAQRDEVGAPFKFTRALSYSAAVITFQKPEPRPATTVAQAIVLLETVLGPVQAALLALAIRRKFMR